MRAIDWICAIAVFIMVLAICLVAVVFAIDAIKTWKLEEEFDRRQREREKLIYAERSEE